MFICNERGFEEVIQPLSQGGQRCKFVGPRRIYGFSREACFTRESSSADMNTRKAQRSRALRINNVRTPKRYLPLYQIEAGDCSNASYLLHSASSGHHRTYEFIRSCFGSLASSAVPVAFVLHSRRVDESPRYQRTLNITGSNRQCACDLRFEY